jgi:hypothetical protein
LQEIEFQRLTEAQRLQHEEILKAMEVHGKTIEQIAAVLLNAQMQPGINSGLDNTNLPAFLQTMMQAMPTVAAPAVMAPTLTPVPAPTAVVSLRERLINELTLVLKLGNVQCAAPRICGSNEMQVIIRYQNWRFIIVCGDDYPDQPPLSVAVYQDNQPILVEREVWANSGNLQELVFTITAHLLAQTLKPQPGGNGHTPRQPEPFAD